MNEKLCIFIKIHCSLFQGSNWQQLSIGLDNGLVPNRQQAIIWNNADQIHMLTDANMPHWEEMC